MSGEQNSRKMRRSSRRLNRGGGGAIVFVEHGWVEPTRSDSQFNAGESVVIQHATLLFYNVLKLLPAAAAVIISFATWQAISVHTTHTYTFQTIHVSAR